MNETLIQGAYIVAALLLPVGATFGVLLARGLGDPWHGRLLVAHSMINLLGWVGLTVLGTLDKPVDSQIGDHKYRFSLLKVTASKLWPPVKEVEIRYMDPYFYDPFYDPFWPRRHYSRW